MSTTTVPADYLCKICRATGIKLWRDTGFAGPFDLSCFNCACQVLGPLRPDDSGDFRAHTSDQLGNLVPAVPTKDGLGYWGYSAVPDDAVDWWYSLPNRPGCVHLCVGAHHASDIQNVLHADLVAFGIHRGRRRDEHIDVWVEAPNQGLLNMYAVMVRLKLDKVYPVRALPQPSPPH